MTATASRRVGRRSPTLSIIVLGLVALLLGPWAGLSTAQAPDPSASAPPAPGTDPAGAPSMPPPPATSNPLAPPPPNPLGPVEVPPPTPAPLGPTEAAPPPTAAPLGPTEAAPPPTPAPLGPTEAGPVVSPPPAGVTEAPPVASPAPVPSGAAISTESQGLHRGLNWGSTEAAVRAANSDVKLIETENKRRKHGRESSVELTFNDAPYGAARGWVEYEVGKKLGLTRIKMRLRADVDKGIAYDSIEAAVVKDLLQRYGEPTYGSVKLPASDPKASRVVRWISGDVTAKLERYSPRMLEVYLRKGRSGDSH